MLRHLILTWTLATVALAGCAETAAPTIDEAERSVEGLDVAATETTGVIRGIVVDEAIRPIEGALVAVQGTERSTTSNVDGAFGFDDLEPGTYFLEVTHVRHATVQSSANVEAGIDTPPIIRVQMQSLDLPDPYHEIQQVNVFLDFSVCVVTCLSCCGFLTNQDTSATYEGIDMAAESGTDYVQALTVWRHTQPTGEQSLVRTWLYDADDARIATITNTQPSPVVQEFRDIEDLDQQPGPFEMRGAIWAAGEEGGLFGAVIQQEYEVFFVATIHYTPAEGYRFDVDGEPTPPY